MTQEALFDVSLYLKPRPKRQRRGPNGPQALFDVLRKYNHGLGCFPFQETVAEVMGVCVRTVQRWLQKLIEMGQVKARRRSTGSNMYFLAPPRLPDPSPPPMSPVMSCPIKEESKPDSTTKSRAVPVEMPPDQIPNEYGRMVSNPIYTYLVGVMRSASERIKRARNPRAYHDAILREELGKIGQ